MNRPREFDKDQLLECAMQNFWVNGFQHTSMRKLESETGVKQVSIYNAFGNKESLFLAVLNRYEELFLNIMDSHMEGRELNGIVSFAKSITTLDSNFPNSEFGCLVANSVNEIENFSIVISRKLKSTRSMVHGRIVEALKRARNNGKLKESLDIKECADYIMAIFWGIFTLNRLTGNRESGRLAINMLTKTLRNWRIDSG